MTAAPSGLREPPPLPPISVRVPEAVRLTGLSRSRLYELLRTGDIEYVKVGSSTLVLVDSLRRFIESRRS
jgi:excisionase family DNA binding protein